jgi:5-methylcytosine-specific restriction enzyme subunit McrC
MTASAPIQPSAPLSAPSPPIMLTETGPGIVRALTQGQLAALLAMPDTVRITPAAGGCWRLTGNQKVGLIRIGHGTDALELHVQPKLPISHLLFLLTYTPHDPWRPDPVTFATSTDDLVPALAALLARTAQRTLDTGVLYGYRTTEDDLPLIRGRIRTTDQMRRVGLPLPVAVRYDDHTPDIPENQILLTALRKMEPLPGTTPDTRLLLRHLAARLATVQPLAPGAPLPAWTPTRLNTRYHPALRLAELLLADRTLQPQGPTGHRGDGFLLDMPRVFEKFLETALGEHLRSHGVRCTPQEAHHRLDHANLVRLRPDLVLYRDGRIHTVIDAKYKELHAAAPPTEHMYQLLSYCTAFELPTGHLVYAGGTSTQTVVHQIRGSGVTIYEHTLDLTRTPNALLASVATLAAKLA